MAPSSRSTASAAAWQVVARSLNEAIAELRPLLNDLQPVARNLASPRTQLDRFFKGLGAAAAEVAPVAEEQAALFGNLDATFTALAGVARPFLQDFDLRAARHLRHGDPRVPAPAPLPAQQRGLLPRAAARHRRPCRPPRLSWRTPSRSASARCRGRRRSTGSSPASSTRSPSSPRTRGCRSASGVWAHRQARCGRRSRYLTPAQTTCNYVTLFFRNVASHLSEGDAVGTWQRFIIKSAPPGPNNEGSPSERAGQRPRHPQLPAREPVPEHRRRRARPRSARPGTRTTCSAAS